MHIHAHTHRHTHMEPKGNRTHGQQSGDCGGEQGARGINGDGRNTFRKKKVSGRELSALLTRVLSGE